MSEAVAVALARQLNKWFHTDRFAAYHDCGKSWIIDLDWIPRDELSVREGRRTRKEVFRNAKRLLRNRGAPI